MNYPIAGATRIGPLRLIVFMCSAAFLFALSSAASARSLAVRHRVGFLQHEFQQVFERHKMYAEVRPEIHEM